MLTLEIFFIWELRSVFTHGNILGGKMQELKTNCRYICYLLFAPLEKSSFFWAENLDSKSQYLEVFEETNSDFHKFTPFFSVKKVNFVEKKDLNFSLTDELRRKRSSITGFDRDVSGSYLNSYFDAAPSWNFAVYRLNIMPLVESGLFNGVVNSNPHSALALKNI